MKRPQRKSIPTTDSSLLGLDTPPRHPVPLARAEPLRTRVSSVSFSLLGHGRKGLGLEKGQGQPVLFSNSKTEQTRGNHPSDELCRGQAKAESEHKRGGAHLLGAVYIT